ncbi:hypothetical protein ACWC09_25790 [Streptomyces sp. NPDC001617]
MVNTPAKPLDQLLFRWEGNRNQYVTGIAAAAHSCDDRRAEELRALLAPLLRVEGTGSRRPSLVRYLIPETGEAVLIHRRPALDARGRESTASHALVGSPQVLTGRESISLAAPNWKWTGLSDDATGRIDPLPEDVLRQRFDETLPLFVDEVALVRKPLEVAVAQLLRTPGHRLTFLRQDIVALEKANYAPPLIWGLCAMLGPWLGDETFTFASFDTQEHAGLRLVCVPEWPRSAVGGSAAQRITFADAVVDEAHTVAAELVRLFLADPGRPDHLAHVLEACPQPRRRSLRDRLDMLMRALPGGPPHRHTVVPGDSAPAADLLKKAHESGDARYGLTSRPARDGTAPVPSSVKPSDPVARPEVSMAEPAEHTVFRQPVAPVSAGADSREGTAQEHAPGREQPSATGEADTPVSDPAATESETPASTVPEPQSAEFRGPESGGPGSGGLQSRGPGAGGRASGGSDSSALEPHDPEPHDPLNACWQDQQALFGPTPGQGAQGVSGTVRPSGRPLPDSAMSADQAQGTLPWPTPPSAGEPPGNTSPTGVSPAAAQKRTGEGAQAHRPPSPPPASSGPDPMNGSLPQEWKAGRNTGAEDPRSGQGDRRTEATSPYSAGTFTPRTEGAASSDHPFTETTAATGLPTPLTTGPTDRADSVVPPQSLVEARMSVPVRSRPGQDPSAIVRGGRTMSPRTGQTSEQPPLRAEKLRRLGKWLSPLWWQQRPRAHEDDRWILTHLGDSADQSMTVTSQQIADTLRRQSDEDLCDALDRPDLEPQSAVRLLTALEERTRWRTLPEAQELAACLLDRHLYLHHAWRISLDAEGDTRHGGTAGAIRMFRWAVRPHARDVCLRESLEALVFACTTEAGETEREFWRHVAFDGFDPAPDLPPTVWRELARIGPWEAEAPPADRPPASIRTAYGRRRRSTRAAHRTPPDDSRKIAAAAVALVAVVVLLVLLELWTGD